MIEPVALVRLVLEEGSTIVMEDRILILLGSDSDLGRVKPAFDLLEALEVPYRVTLASAHRDPERVAESVAAFEERGGGVIICGAGLAAHLAGAVAARTVLPVVGLPLSGGPLSGLDALLSTVQMPKGMPVGTVGIDQAENAALLALQVLALSDPALRDRLVGRRLAGREALREKDRRLQATGPLGYGK